MSLLVKGIVIFIILYFLSYFIYKFFSTDCIVSEWTVCNNNRGSYNEVNIEQACVPKVPNGAYRNTCISCYLEKNVANNNILKCKCKNGQGYFLSTSLNIDNCVLDDGIRNKNSYLKCVTYKR